MLTQQWRSIHTLRKSQRGTNGPRSHVPTHFHDAMAVDSSMRSEADGGWCGRIEPKPPGMVLPAEGRSAKECSKVLALMTFFA